MSRAPGLAAFDAPTVDMERLRSLTGVEKPKTTPSLWSQFSTATTGAAGNDDPAVSEARRRDAIEAALAPIVTGLEERGLPGNYTRRLARDGFSISYDEDAIWQGIARARARDGKAFEGVEGAPDAFRKRVTAPVDAQIADEQDVQARSSWAPWLAGKFIGGMADPENQAAMLVGGGQAKSLLDAALREARVNAMTEAVMEPERIIAKAKRGETTTAGDVVQDIALAGGTGAVFGGALHGGAHAITARVKSPAGQTADAVRAEIGEDRLTDGERDALRTLDKVDETLSISPYHPGAGGDQFLAQMDAATATLDAPRGRPISTATAAARVRADPWETFKGRVRRAESGGDDAAKNPLSSATGRYQVIDSTWLRMARRFPEAEGRNDASLLQMRSHPVWQERVMDALGAEYRQALARAGAPETPGNLYLMHFAGTGGGAKILRAAPDAPIETILSHEAITANPFLKGMTAEDAITWADGKMGQAGAPGARLRRDVFADDAAGDAAYTAAQREADDAAAELAALRREDMPPLADDDIPFDLDDARGTTRAASDWLPGDDAAPTRWSEAVTALRTAQGGEAIGALYHPEIGAIDVKWGATGDPARDFKGGHGLAHILAKHPEMEAQIDNLPQMIEAMTVKQHRSERIVLESADHEASIALTWHDKDQRWLVTAYEKDAPADPTSERGSIGGGSGSPRPGAKRDILPTADQSKAAQQLRTSWASDLARGETPKPMYAVRAAEGGEMMTWSPSRALAERTAREEPGEWEVARVHPPADLGELPSSMRSEATMAFDDPDGEGATRQIDSMEHDLRMWLAEDEAAGMTVRLNEDGDVISAADALEDADLDLSALDAAEACMKPGGGE